VFDRAARLNCIDIPFVVANMKIRLPFGLAVILGYLVVVAVAIGLMPTYDEVPSDFPASVLYTFRRASLATQLTLWAVLGVVLAEFGHRLTRNASPPVAVDSAVRSSA